MRLFGTFAPWGFGVPSAFFSPLGFGGAPVEGVTGPGPTACYTPWGFCAGAGRPFPPPYTAGASLGPTGMGAGFGIW